MQREIKNLPDQLAAYSVQIQAKIEKYQAELAAENEKDIPDLTKQSQCLGGIWAIAMYESYLDIMFGNNDPDPEKRVEEHQDWLVENSHIPAEASTFRGLVNWLEDFFTSEMLIPDSMLNLEAQEKVEREYADYDYDQVKQGMLMHLQWLRETLLPTLMPASWKQEDTPEIYKSIVNGGMKRALN